MVAEVSVGSFLADCEKSVFLRARVVSIEKTGSLKYERDSTVVAENLIWMLGLILLYVLWDECKVLRRKSLTSWRYLMDWIPWTLWRYSKDWSP